MEGAVSLGFTETRQSWRARMWEPRNVPASRAGDAVRAAVISLPRALSSAPPHPVLLGTLVLGPLTPGPRRALGPPSLEAPSVFLGRLEQQGKEGFQRRVTGRGAGGGGGGRSPPDGGLPLQAIKKRAGAEVRTSAPLWGTGGRHHRRVGNFSPTW